MLRATIHPAGDITLTEQQAMLELMREYYANVEPVAFHADLCAKDFVIVLREGDKLRGFSTQKLTAYDLSGQRVNVLFSGDTIIDRAHRNSLALPLAWTQQMFSILRDDPATPLHWLLTSKGYKTYRYLPIFFKQFFPTYGRGASEIERKILLAATPSLVDDLSRLDQTRWIIRAETGSQKLRPGVADITPPRRANPDIASFESLNPGHARGDELICLVHIEESNFKPFILKRLESSC